jgi:hypothetical protein
MSMTQLEVAFGGNSTANADLQGNIDNKEIGKSRMLSVLLPMPCFKKSLREKTSEK